MTSGLEQKASVRLPKPARRHQLLGTAMAIVREEGADRLTLGHLAARAGVSKPVVYDHFATRSTLLIELYRWIDTERVAAFRAAMTEGDRSAGETITMLADVYIACAADRADEFHAIGAALAGSKEKTAVFQELLGNVVDMFDAILRPFSTLCDADHRRACVGLIGAGEALAGSVAQAECTSSEAAQSLRLLIGSLADAD